MTLEEFKNTDDLFVNCTDVCSFLECDAAQLRNLLKNDAESVFGFKCFVIGNRVKIPTNKLRQFLGLETETQNNQKEK